jgi:hypothetical protein
MTFSLLLSVGAEHFSEQLDLDLTADGPRFSASAENATKHDAS